MSHEYEQDAEDDFFADGGADGLDGIALPSIDEMDTADLPATEPSDITQHLLLSYLVASPDLWVKCSPIIKAEYFDPQYRPVIKKIQQFMADRGFMPNPKILHVETGIRLDDVTDAHEEVVQEWVCDSIEEFCRTTAYQDHLLKAVEVTSVDKSRNALAALMKEAEAIQQITLVRNLGVEVHTGTVEILSQSEKFDNISTGFKLMDHAFSGGFTRPSFNIVSCASGDGKSIYMQNQLINYIEQGMNCIFYSLELEPAIVLKRFAAMMTNTDIDIIYGHLDTVGHTLRTRGKKDGALWVKKFPMIGTTMSDVAAHYLELQMHSNLHFGAVAIDYVDIMTPIQQVDHSNIHMKDKFVSEEMNNWAHKINIILWSASQQTKGAQDEKDPRQSGVAGGTPKINTCDNLIIGKRNEDDKEDSRWWAHVAKTRSSGAMNTKIPLHWHPKTMRMSDGDRAIYEENNPRLFNRKRVMSNSSSTPDKVMNDPLVKEQGAVMNKTEEISGRGKKVIDRMSRLRGLTHPQEGVSNG
jgi:KaiC/GvpD/RAD55 family RecA-like ATPase